MTVQGKPLCEAFYHRAVAPILAAHFPAMPTPRPIGYGSDVLGYDDALSQDHGVPGAICSCQRLGMCPGAGRSAGPSAPLVHGLRGGFLPSRARRAAFGCPSPPNPDRCAR